MLHNDFMERKFKAKNIQKYSQSLQLTDILAPDTSNNIEKSIYFKKYKMFVTTVLTQSLQSIIQLREQWKKMGTVLACLAHLYLKCFIILIGHVRSIKLSKTEKNWSKDV